MKGWGGWKMALNHLCFPTFKVPVDTTPVLRTGCTAQEITAVLRGSKTMMEEAAHEHEALTGEEGEGAPKMSIQPKHLLVSLCLGVSRNTSWAPGWALHSCWDTGGIKSDMYVLKKVPYWFHSAILPLPTKPCWQILSLFGRLGTHSGYVTYLTSLLILQKLFSVLLSSLEECLTFLNWSECAAFSLFIFPSHQLCLCFFFCFFFFFFSRHG